jgi:NTE family protein
MKKRLAQGDLGRTEPEGKRAVPVVGLALGSGSARGWSHLGVIRAIREAGFPIDVVAGTSMGAMVAGAYAAGFIDSLEDWARRLTWPDIIGFMDVSFPGPGYSRERGSWGIWWSR